MGVLPSSVRGLALDTSQRCSTFQKRVALIFTSWRKGRKLSVTKKRVLEAVRKLRSASNTVYQWAHSLPYDEFITDLMVLCDYIEDKHVADEQLEADFKLFWACYPRKVAPDAARKALKKRLKEGGRELMTQIMLALERQAKEWANQKQERKFIPYAATWLNQGRFLDVLETAPKGRARSKDADDFLL